MLLKPLLLSRYEEGGAGRACVRLHLGLRGQGVESVLVTRDREAAIPAHRSARFPQKPLAKKIESLALRYGRGYATRPGARTWPANLEDDGAVECILRQEQPNVVNLHWPGTDFFSLPSITRLATPLVWTFHDMSAFTGGCSYSAGCRRFEQECGACPLIEGHEEDDASRWVHDYKTKHWSGKPIAIVCPSRWLLREARLSPVFARASFHLVPYGLDTDLYKPQDKAAARALFNLPPDGQLILFGSHGGTRDPRKGYDLLIDALRSLARDPVFQNVELVTFGHFNDAHDLPFPSRHVCSLNDQVSMAMLLSACDVLVVASREDNLPLLAQEAISCGLPTLAFDIGGLPDIVKDGETGFIAREVSSASLSDRLREMIARPALRASMSRAARADAVARYSLAGSALAYKSIFEDLIDRSPKAK